MKTLSIISRDLLQILCIYHSISVKIEERYQMHLNNEV